MFGVERPHLVKPGLFITATDTAVGKTVVTCAITHALRQERRRVGVCKPFASGCLTSRHGLVSQDALALEEYADSGQPMRIINPIRYGPPLAPAVAARQSGRSPEGARIAESLEALDADNDFLLIEGIGGLLVPLDEGHTVLDFAAWLGSLPTRNRRIAEMLAGGAAGKDVARRFGISPGRVSQLRGELREHWQCFRGEEFAS